MTRRNCKCRTLRRVLYWLLLFMNARSPRKKGRRGESKREFVNPRRVSFTIEWKLDLSDGGITGKTLGQYDKYYDKIIRSENRLNTLMFKIL